MSQKLNLFRRFNYSPYFQKKSLKFKFLIAVLPPVTICFLVISLIAGILSYNNVKKDILNRYQRDAQAILTPISLSLWNLDHSVINSQILSLLHHPDISGVKVVENLHQQEYTAGDVPDAQTLPGHLVFSVDINFSSYFDTENLGTLYLYFKKQQILDQQIRQFMQSSALFLIVIVIVIIAAVSAYNQTINMPLTKLVDSIRTFDRDGNATPVEWTSDDEIGEVIASYNGLIVSLEMGNSQLKTALEKARKANAVKGEFLANISHEIRTPLNGIQGMAELVLDTPLNREQTEFLTIIHAEAGQLLIIINDILDFSKIEAGKMQIDQAPFDLRSTIDTLCSPFHVQAREKGIEFHHFIDAGAEIPLVGDPGRLRQILVNLLGNAVKFTHKGEVHLSIETAESSDRSVRLRFSVSDTGIGIAEDKQEMVFESFSQADGSTTREFGGTGLGITISQKLIEQMGGKLSMTSTLGVGTRFVFEIEFLKQAGLNAPPVLPDICSADLSGQRSIRILVAEDYKTTQTLVTRQLESAGCTVTLAANGREAVDLFARHPFDLILMDIQMPEMDGYTACHHIRKRKPKGTRIPIIAMTAHAMDGFRRQCMDAGMDDYITKPLKRSELLAAVHRWTQQGIYRPENGTGPDQTTVTASDDPLNLSLAINEFENDADLFYEVLDEFIHHVHTQLAIMDVALENNDFSTLAQHAHAIKGGAANLTAMALSTAAHQMETAAKNQCREKLKMLQQKIIDEYRRLKSFRKKQERFPE